MTNRRKPPVSVGTATAFAAAEAPALLSTEKTPEEKAVIAAAVQAPPGAAEPFAAVAPADIAKNIAVADAAAGLGVDADALGGPIDRSPLLAPIVPASGAAIEGTVTSSLSAPISPATTDELRADEIGALDDLDVTGRIIMVRSVSDRGRRRAGISFGPVPQRVEVDSLTADELGGLLADAQLVVSLDD